MHITSSSTIDQPHAMVFAGLLAGPVLYWRRFGALFVKRACCARRDRLAVITQLAVPIALVLVALWAGKAYVNAPDESPLAISM